MKRGANREIPGLLRRPPPIGRRSLIVLTLVAMSVVAGLALGLTLEDLTPEEPGKRSLRRFLYGAAHPKLPQQDAVGVIAGAVWRTVVFAAASMGAAVVLALPLALLASEAFWEQTRMGRGRLRFLRPVLSTGVRFLIAGLRSIHELLWAVLLMAAM